MSNLSTFKEIDSVNLIGIERITKFKYRHSKPANPKPGTFYWIEETIDNKSQQGLYFTTNNEDLKRLDSEIYNLGIRDSDGYIRITDKNDFDKQELYLIIGKYYTEDENGRISTISDETIPDNSPNGELRIFKITNNEYMGLATVESTVEYVSDSNNMLYRSKVPDYYKVGKRLGDILINQTNEDLKNHTISEILDTIIYPTLQPTHTDPTVILSNKLISQNNKNVFFYNDADIPNLDDINISNLLSEKLLTFDRGHLTYVTEELNKDGEPYTLNYYAGEPILVDSSEDNNGIKLEIKKPKNDEGTYSIKASIYFNKGTRPLDNKRNPAVCDCDDEICKCTTQPFNDNETEKEGRIYSNELIYNVVYPIFSNCYTEKNNKITNLEKYPTPLNYFIEDGCIEYLEFPPETDTVKNANGEFSEQLLCQSKMCICIPDDITSFNVYQYNELTQSYDIKIDMKSINFAKNEGSKIYNTYIRTLNPYDTNVESVKYKIIIWKK